MTVEPGTEETELWGEVLGLVPDPAMLRRRDDGVILEANEAFAELVGEEREDVLGRPLDELDLGTRPEERDAYFRALDQQGEVRDFPLHVAVDDGWRVHLISSRLVDHRGAACVLSVAKDITERQRTQRQLEESERRYRQLFDRNAAGTFRSTLDGTLLECNEAFAEMLGWDAPEELEGRPVRELYATPEKRGRRMERLREEGALAGAELELQRRDGSPVWVLENSFLVEEDEGAVNMGTLVDISDRKRLERRLERMAHRDSLTGLANRRLLRERGEAALARADRAGERVGLIFLDLARFKRVNDTLGHSAGDEVLVMAAKRLESCLRAGDDLLARVGGDEFVALVPGIEAQEDAHRVAERFEVAFRDPFRIEDGAIHLDLRMGLALYPDHASNFSELLSCADHAMYEADVASGENMAVYETVMGPGPEGGLAREEALRRALEEDELLLHFQPIYTAGGDVLRGAETLVRWEHPEAGLLSAAEFVPLAERSGLIRRLDEWVLRATVDQLAAWEEEGGGPDWVSVNVSASTLSRPDLPGMTASLLDDRDVPGERLVVEITERVALRDPEEVAETLRALRDRGIRVAVDDFGTGHAVLAYLRQFVANILKLDMVFVQQMAEEPRDAELVAGIAALGRQLDMEVLAEGVETAGQLERLREMGVGMAQGYHLGRPRPAEELGGD